MAAKLEGEKILLREVKVYGVESPVTLEFSAQGIRAWVKGNKLKLSGLWPSVLDALVVPSQAKSYLVGKPVEFLKHQAAQRLKRLSRSS